MNSEHITAIAKTAVTLIHVMNRGDQSASTYNAKFESLFFQTAVNKASDHVSAKAVYDSIRMGPSELPISLVQLINLLSTTYPDKREHIPLAVRLSLFSQLKGLPVNDHHDAPVAVPMPNPFASQNTGNDNTIRGAYQQAARNPGGDGRYVSQMDPEGNRFRTRHANGFTTETILGPAASRTASSVDDVDDATLFSEEYWADAHTGIFRMDDVNDEN